MAGCRVRPGACGQSAARPDHVIAKKACRKKQKKHCPNDEKVEMACFWLDDGPCNQAVDFVVVEICKVRYNGRYSCTTGGKAGMG